MSETTDAPSFSFTNNPVFVPTAPTREIPKTTPPPSEQEDKIGIPTDWSEQEEYLLALWADRSLCYKIMSERASRKFARNNMYFAIPVIILTTLCGSANLGVNSYVPASEQSTASAIIGIISLFTGILTTLQTFFSFSTKSEAHRNASTSWGKLHRVIFTQLSLERAKRQPAKSFLRQSKNEYDQILEQSPVVPSPILRSFVEDIKKHPHLMLPEECGNLLHSASWEHVRHQRIMYLEMKQEANVIEAMGDTP